MKIFDPKIKKKNSFFEIIEFSNRKRKDCIFISFMEN